MKARADEGPSGPGRRPTAERAGPRPSGPGGGDRRPAKDERPAANTRAPALPYRQLPGTGGGPSVEKPRVLHALTRS
jgi:hypothetical protein